MLQVSTPGFPHPESCKSRLTWTTDLLEVITTTKWLMVLNCYIFPMDIPEFMDFHALRQKKCWINQELPYSRGCIRNSLLNKVLLNSQRKREKAQWVRYLFPGRFKKKIIRVWLPMKVCRLSSKNCCALMSWIGIFKTLRPYRYRKDFALVFKATTGGPVWWFDIVSCIRNY